MLGHLAGFVSGLISALILLSWSNSGLAKERGYLNAHQDTVNVVQCPVDLRDYPAFIEALQKWDKQPLTWERVTKGVR